MFDVLAQNEKIKIERIVSKGHTSPDVGWYDQEQSEWVMVLKGGATIGFEDNDDIELNAGDHLTILPHVKHRVCWTTPGIETVWLAVHY